MERTAEIGLRRAIGATRRHIAAQFLFESASMGVIGGILGASLGVIIVVAVSAYQLWTPVLDPWAPFLAPLVGGALACCRALSGDAGSQPGACRSLPKIGQTSPVSAPNVRRLTLLAIPAHSVNSNGSEDVACDVGRAFDLTGNADPSA